MGSNLAYWLKRANQKEIFCFEKDLELFFNADKNWLQNIIDQAEIIFIAASESKIGSVVSRLADFNIDQKIITHLSNALDSEILSPLKLKNALIASFSPLQTFPELNKRSSPFKNCFFLFEGDLQAEPKLRHIAHSLHSRFLSVQPENKKFLHLAAVFASNHLLAILKTAEELIQGLKTSGLNFEILWPLILRTISNAQQRGIAQSYTGPARRKESEIIFQHLKLLSQKDQQLYLLLTEKITQ